MFKAAVSGLAIALSFSAAAQSQARSAPASPSLESLYRSALESQKAGKLDEAGQYYRSFLSAALNELANGQSWIGDSAKASSLFEEALGLAPDSAAIERDYAQSALRAGNLKQAQTLAAEALARDAGDSGGQAEDHQILGLALHRMNRDQDARKELEAAVALNPGFENRYDLAVVCLDMDDEKCADDAFDAIEASTPDTAALHMRIGLAYGNSDFTSRAVAEFKKAIAEDPRYPEAHYCVAAALLAAGEDEKTLAQAETELKEELAITPNDFLTYAALGKIAVSYHRYAEAERYLKRAIALNGKNPDAFLYMGQMDYETGRLSEAEANLRKSIQLTTDVSRNHYQIEKAHFLLGRILMQQHREAEAHAEMRIAQAFTNKSLNKDKSNLSGMLPAGDGGASHAGASVESSIAAEAPKPADPEAKRKQKALEDELRPAIADSYNNMGAIAASHARYAEAVRDFEQARAWKPSLEGLDYNLGRAAFLASDFQDAVPALERYSRSHPADTGSRGALAVSEFMVHNYSACIAAFKGAAASVALLPQMQYIYAESLVHTGRLAEGVARLKALEKAHPETAEVHRGLAEAGELRGDWVDAIDELREAIRLNPEDPESHYDLGRADLETGSLSEAVSELELAVRLKPDEARYHQELATAYERVFRPSDAERERQAYEKLLSAPASAGKAAPAGSAAR